MSSPRKQPTLCSRTTPTTSPKQSKRNRARGERPLVKGSRLDRPTLARVVIQGSSKPSQIMLVKPGERRKRTSSTGSKALSEPASGASTPRSAPPAYDFDTKVSKQGQPVERPTVQRSKTADEAVKPLQAASDAPPEAPPPAEPIKLRNMSSTPKLIGALIGQDARRLQPKCEAADTTEAPLATTGKRGTSGKSTGLRAIRSTPRLQGALSDQIAAPLSPTERREDHIEPRRKRQPTPTYYSVASDQTKLGEIPLHKWPQPFDFDAMSLANQQAIANGWPLNQVAENEGKKKRFGIFKLFRNREGATRSEQF